MAEREGLRELEAVSQSWGLQGRLPMSMLEPVVGQPADDRERLETHYASDPDVEKPATLLPLVFQVGDDWLMCAAERMAMICLLEHLRPKVAVEIGTRFGGSLQVLARFCERVYSLDIDPEVPRRLEGKYPNVEYLIGPSDQTLPLLINRLQSEHAEVSFALVDGDHTEEGVRKDIDNLLRFRPVVPLYIMMHDSFNPTCRRGIRAANWSECPYVHAVELDFVPGVYWPLPVWGSQLWNGLALGVLKPEPRQGRLEVTGQSERTYEVAYKEELRSSRRPLVRRILNRMRMMLHTATWSARGE
jgi:Methyltransferase domain